MPGRRFCRIDCPYCGIFIVINFLSHIFFIAIGTWLLEYSASKVGKQKSDHFGHLFCELLTTLELHQFYFVFRIDFITTDGPADYKMRNAEMIFGFVIDHKLGIMYGLSTFASSKSYQLIGRHKCFAFD